MSSPRGAQVPPRARVWRACAPARILALLVVLTFGLAAAPRLFGATGTTVVTVNIPSASWVDVAACAPGTANVTDFGPILPEIEAVTSSDCAVEYGSSNDTAMLRTYQTDGSGSAMSTSLNTLDTAYGGGDGLSDLPVLGGGPEQYAMAFQSDGKLVLSARGGAGDNFVAVRFDTNGTLDTSFGGDGISDYVNIGGLDEPRGLLVLSSGKIILAGHFYGNRFAAVRLNSNGTLDTGYGGGDGISTLVNLGGATQMAHNVLLLPNDQILVTGRGGAGTDFVAVKYNADGSLDTTWAGGDGISAYANVGGTETGYYSHLLPDGKFFITGTGGASSDFVAVKYNADGSLDTSYGGGDGISDVVNIGGTDDGRMSHILPNGKMLITGSGGAGTDAVAIRLNSDGSLDTTYGGGDGIAPLVDFGAGYSLSSILLPDERLAVFGGSGGYQVRYTSNGALDTTFDNDGIAGPNGSGVFDSILLSDGKIMTSTGGQAARLDVALIPQYANGVTDWDTAAPNDATFGVCVRQVTNGALAGGSAWTEAPGNACTATDGTHWNAVPAAAPGAKVSYINGPDAEGGATDPTVRIRFGVRIAAAQKPGTYTAPITFETVAPNI